MIGCNATMRRPTSSASSCCAARVEHDAESQQYRHVVACEFTNVQQGECAVDVAHIGFEISIAGIQLR